MSGRGARWLENVVETSGVSIFTLARFYPVGMPNGTFRGGLVDGWATSYNRWGRDVNFGASLSVLHDQRKIQGRGRVGYWPTL